MELERSRAWRLAVSGAGGHHGRVLVAAFSEIDRLFGEIENLAAQCRSPLSRLVDDLSPSQHAEITSHVSYVREQMVQAMATFEAPRRAREGSATGAILTRLSFAQIALDEVDPKRLRGYGELAPGAVEVLERLLADLSRSLRAMRRSLEEDPQRDRVAALSQSKGAPVDLSLVEKVSGVMDRHGLVELRPLLDALIEQLSSGTFEVAVFGRVSSGKSSLLNAILGRSVLPVGVTPVTAVPTRIVSGKESQLTVSLLHRPEDQTFPIDEVESFVSEAKNPGNTKGVRRITVTVDSESLPPGIALVDTPGVGALALAGARQTFTYLPRCDLGVILLDAGGSVSPDEVRLVQSLRDSAIPAMIVISKADLVAPSDQQTVVDYVRTELRTASGLDLPPHLVSSIGPLANAREWFDREIAPLLESARANAEASSRRKLAQLCESAVSSLRSLQGQTDVRNETRALVDRVAGEAERRLQKRRARCDTIADTASDLATPILRLAAYRLVELGKEANEHDVVRAAIRLACDEVCSQMVGELKAARDDLQRFLSNMADAIGEASPRDPAAVSLDLMSLPTVAIPDAIDAFHASRSWLRVSSMQARRMQEQLAREIGAPTQEAVRRFARELRDWSHGALDRLSDQFASEAGPLRARVRLYANPKEARIAEDLELLTAAPGRRPAPAG